MAKEFVYFIRGKDSGRIKIGWTRQLWERLNDIRAHSGEGIELLAHVIGQDDESMRQREARLHRHFKHARLHNEWYSPDPELLATIEGLRNRKTADELAYYDSMQEIFIADPERL